MNIKKLSNEELAILLYAVAPFYEEIKKSEYYKKTYIKKAKKILDKLEEEYESRNLNFTMFEEDEGEFRNLNLAMFEEEE